MSSVFIPAGTSITSAGTTGSSSTTYTVSDGTLGVSAGSGIYSLPIYSSSGTYTILESTYYDNETCTSISGKEAIEAHFRKKFFDEDVKAIIADET